MIGGLLGSSFRRRTLAICFLALAIILVQLSRELFQHDFAYEQAKRVVSSKIAHLLINSLDLPLLKAMTDSQVMYQAASLIGDNLSLAQEYSNASRYQKRALVLADQIFGTESAQSTKRLGRLVETMYFLDQYQTALPLAERCVTLSKKLYGEDSLETAEHQADLALIYSYNDRPLEAVSLARSALNTRIRKLGFLNESTIELLRQYAEVGRDLPLGAERGARIEMIALALSEKSLGWESIRTATIINDIDWFLRQQGDCQEALSYSIEALNLSIKLDGPITSETANRYHSLGTNYFCLGDLTNAIKFTEQALEISRQIFGEKHSRVAYLEAELADWLEQSGHLELAKTKAHEAIATLNDTMGDSHPNAPDVLDFVGTAALQWDATWSKELSLRYLAKMKIDFGEDDIALVDPLINLANAELILGNSHKGLSYALRASALTIGYAESHHTLPDDEALDALVLAELSLGHQTEATRHAFMALQYAEQRSGLNHPYTSHAYQQLASAIRDKQPSIAVTLLKRSIQLDWSSVDALPDSDQGHLRNMQTVIRPHCERLNDWLTRDHRQRETNQWRTELVACSKPPAFTKIESNWLARYDDVSRRRISLDRPIRLLKLEDEQGSVNASDLRLMNQLESRIGMRKAELNQLFNDRMLRSRKSTPSLDRRMVGLMQKRISREKEKTGWVHYESSETALKITLITELEIKEVSLDLGVDTLKKHIKASQFNTDRLRSLYLILFAPIRDVLIQQHITSLWIDPKGFASGIPFAALTDGERELINSYAFTFVSPQWIHDEKTIRRSMTIAGFGLSNEVSGLRELPWVRSELHDLEELNRYDGVSVRTYLDESFTEHAVEKEIAKGSTIFHFATHFIDSPGTRASSSLLLGDGHHLSSERLTNLIRGKNISLISLSACNTATASQRLEDAERTEDSLIANLLSGGVSSVIGTLWKIEDHDSYEFMLRFYRNYFSSPDSINTAFHKTQLDLSRNITPDHWAGFTLYQ